MRIAAMLVCLILAAAAVAPAQETAPANPPDTYRLTFVIHETEDGKPAAAHTYTMLLDDGANGSIRTGTQVAITMGGPSFQYKDVGMNLGCALRSRDGQLGLKTSLSFSQIAGEGQAGMRQTSTENTAVIPAGKPTTILTLDDWASKRHYEVQVTAVKVK